jgi:copper(I)-binding protein
MKRIAVVAALALAIGSCSTPQEVVVDEVWSLPVPPVSPASAIFFNITNGLDSPVTLVGASSPACDRMELHETSLDDAGVMAMRPIAEIRLGPGESRELVPGATHLMCIEPKVFTGSFEVTLDLTNAAAMTVSVAIEQR